jgi:hypothetical protein
MKTSLVRTAVLSGTTLLALGIAGPALACGAGPEWTGSVDKTSVQTAGFTASNHDAKTLTLAEYQAKVDAKLAKTLTRLAEAKTHVADSTRLTDPEKAAKTARIDALVTKIEALRVQVAAATSIADIKADVKAAFAPDVADVKAGLDARLAGWIAKIDAWQAKIAAEDSLDPTQKADKLVKLQAWEDKLVALRADIAADTTLDEVKADLKAADIRGLGLVGEHAFAFRHGHGDRHDDGRKADRASDHRTNGDRTKTSSVSFRFGDRSQDGNRNRGGHDCDRSDGRDGNNDRSGNGSGSGRGHFA